MFKSTKYKWFDGEFNSTYINVRHIECVINISTEDEMMYEIIMTSGRNYYVNLKTKKDETLFYDQIISKLCQEGSNDG